MKALILSILALLLFANLYAQKANRTRTKGSFFGETVRVPIHLLRLNNSKIKNVEALPSTYGDDARQYVLICLPPDSVKVQKQAVFFVHGGGWHVGKPSQHLFLAEMLNEQGFIVILPAYRLTPKVSATEMQTDIAQAFLKSKEILSNQGFDDLTYIAGGASAGANLAALLVYNNDMQSIQGVDNKLFSGFFSVAGALDISQIRKNKILKLYAGKEGSDQFIQSNPVQQIDSNDVQIPVLCIHGENDAMVSLASARSFALELCRLRCDLLTFQAIPEGTHISVGSQWYYKKKKDILQSDTLIRWLLNIEE